MVGKPIDVFYPDLRQHVRLLADPADLPHLARITLGPETLDLRISAIYDRNGAYAGPLLTWRRAPGRSGWSSQFEESVGAIARTVADPPTACA